MILLLIFIILTVLGIIGITKFKGWGWKNELKIGTSWIAAIVGAIALITSIIVIITAHAGADVNRATWTQQYEALQFKVENEQVRDEFGIRNIELINEVQEWNMNVAKLQAQRQNIWVNIFISPAVDDFNTIDINKFNSN